jgi:hypothetical protein
MIINQNIKSLFFYLLFIGLFFKLSIIQAQVYNDGDIYIGDNSALHVDENTFDFGSGRITTSRSKLHYGVLSMSDGSYWAGASEIHFVDGYVQTHSTAAFILPIGQSEIYAPVQVTPSTSEGVDAAYFRLAPKSIGSAFDESISSISSVEYWEINSIGASADISLSWGYSSDISALTSSSLANLTIIGWNGSAWVIIPSIVDEYSILGETSNLDYGSISSNKKIDLSAYSAFSLGSTTKQLLVPEFDKVELMVYLNYNRAFIKASLPITGLIIYEISGKKIFSQRLNGDLQYDFPFNNADGVYIARIELDNGASLVTRKIINRN